MTLGKILDWTLGLFGIAFVAVLIWTWTSGQRPDWVSSFRDGVLAILFLKLIFEGVVMWRRRQMNG